MNTNVRNCKYTRACVCVISMVSAASLNRRSGGVGDDFTLTSRQSSTRTQQLRQVPVAGFQSEPRPDATSTLDSRFRRTQSSSAVYRQDGGTADFSLQNGSAVGTYTLGSTYDEGDYDSVDSMRVGTATTPLSTSSIQRQHRQTTSSSLSHTLPPPSQQPQHQQLTGIIRGHRRTHSTGLGDVDRRPSAQTAFTNGSATTRVKVETDHGGRTNALEDGHIQQVGYRTENIQRQSAARRQGNVVVVANAGYEPTTLERRTPQTVVQAVPVVVDGAPNSVSNSQRLNGDSGRQQSSVRHDQTSTVLHQHVQSPSYATVHKVQQTTGPGPSVFHRAVVVDASEVMPQQQQQQRRNQHETMLKQQEDEIQQLQQQLMTQQQQTQRQSDLDQHQRQRHEQPQHQVLMRQQQNVAASPSRSTPQRLPLIQVGDDDRQSRFNSSTMTTTTSTFERTGTGTRVMGNGGDAVELVMRRAGGTDTPSSMSSAASWRSPSTTGGKPQRLSTASSSGGTTEQSSVELGNDSGLDRVTSFVGKRPFPPFLHLLCIQHHRRHYHHQLHHHDHLRYNCNCNCN